MRQNWILNDRAVFVLGWVLWGATVLGAGTAGGGAEEEGGLFAWRPFLAPFHAVLLHLPIGFVAIAVALELRFLGRGGRESRQAIHLVLGLSVLGSVATIALGLLRGEAGDYEARALALHKWFGVAVGVLTLAAFWLHRRARWGGPGDRVVGLYRLVLGCDLVVLVAAGHFGGNLTHGANYLVRNAPEFVRDLLAAPGGPVGVAAEDEGGLNANSRLARAVLVEKCEGCHGAEKRKGGYQLHTRELALGAGGSGEVAIVPGKPMESHLARLILLPPGDEMAMPPEGKAALSSGEVGAILRWIQEGAPY